MSLDGDFFVQELKGRKRKKSKIRILQGVGTDSKKWFADSQDVIVYGLEKLKVAIKQHNTTVFSMGLWFANNFLIRCGGEMCANLMMRHQTYKPGSREADDQRQ